jgi:predicted RNase H-like HicB family nuclease
MDYTFKVSLQEEEDGRWSAWIDSLPGCAVWAYTRSDAIEELREGAQLYIECMLEHGDSIPNDHIDTIDGVAGEIVAIAV